MFVPLVSSVLYMFVAYTTFVTTAVSLPVIIAVIVLVARLVITGVISWKSPIRVVLKEGEEL